MVKLVVMGEGEAEGEEVEVVVVAWRADVRDVTVRFSSLLSSCSLRTMPGLPRLVVASASFPSSRAARDACSLSRSARASSSLTMATTPPSDPRGLQSPPLVLPLLSLLVLVLVLAVLSSFLHSLLSD